MIPLLRCAAELSACSVFGITVMRQHESGLTAASL